MKRTKTERMMITIEYTNKKSKKIIKRFTDKECIEDMQKIYEACYNAYKKICNQCSDDASAIENVTEDFCEFVVDSVESMQHYIFRISPSYFKESRSLMIAFLEKYDKKALKPYISEFIYLTKYYEE